jgi:hypothetical protein
MKLISAKFCGRLDLHQKLVISSITSWNGVTVTLKHDNYVLVILDYELLTTMGLLQFQKSNINALFDLN